MDGDAFVLLTNEQLKELVPAIGPQAKLLKKHAELIVRHFYAFFNTQI